MSLLCLETESEETLVAFFTPLFCFNGERNKDSLFSCSRNSLFYFIYFMLCWSGREMWKNWNNNSSSEWRNVLKANNFHWTVDFSANCFNELFFELFFLLSVSKLLSFLSVNCSFMLSSVIYPSHRRRWAKRSVCFIFASLFDFFFMLQMCCTLVFIYWSRGISFQTKIHEKEISKLISQKNEVEDWRSLKQVFHRICRVHWVDP